MGDSPDPSARTLSERVVLLGLAALESRDETPAHSFEVKEVCRDRLRDLDAETLGELTDREITRALKTLETGSLVDQASDEGVSPVGKGRPMYRLGLPAGEVFAVLSDDDETGRLAESLRSETP